MQILIFNRLKLLIIQHLVSQVLNFLCSNSSISLNSRDVWYLNFLPRTTFKYLNWLGALLQGFSIELIKASRCHLVQTHKPNMVFNVFANFCSIEQVFSSFAIRQESLTRPGLSSMSELRWASCVTLQPRIFSCHCGKKADDYWSHPNQIVIPIFCWLSIATYFLDLWTLAHRDSVAQTRSFRGIRCVALGGCIFQATTAPAGLQQFFHWSITSLAWGYSQINNWQRKHGRM